MEGKSSNGLRLRGLVYFAVAAISLSWLANVGIADETLRVTKCASDEVTDRLGVVMVQRRLHVAGKSTEQKLRTLMIEEYEAIKQSVNPKKAKPNAFDLSG